MFNISLNTRCISYKCRREVYASEIQYRQSHVQHTDVVGGNIWVIETTRQITLNTKRSFLTYLYEILGINIYTVNNYLHNHKKQMQEILDMIWSHTFHIYRYDIQILHTVTLYTPLLIIYNVYICIYFE